mmetsp:Transcript_172/g.340  ORF Transcript_172/g.340 Transcript_172/m.340 type:complete len:130 (+) Transcript_172:1709-2098(+)
MNITLMAIHAQRKNLVYNESKCERPSTKFSHECGGTNVAGWRECTTPLINPQSGGKKIEVHQCVQRIRKKATFATRMYPPVLRKCWSESGREKSWPITENCRWNFLDSKLPQLNIFHVGRKYLIILSFP